ncbi:MAG TPA: sulfotransferase family protein, partial [Hellea balneolensis]|nr:sulfotransferase family protein [Hellea balneolensis]
MTITTAQPVLILGMHRSGTSCLAGCLQEAGLYLGAVNTKAGFNTKGNREYRAVMELHEHLLNQNNASWDHPPATPVNWQDNELSALIKIAVEFPTHQIWGAKDPRTLFTYL